MHRRSCRCFGCKNVFPFKSCLIFNLLYGIFGTVSRIINANKTNQLGETLFASGLPVTGTAVFTVSHIWLLAPLGRCVGWHVSWYPSGFLYNIPITEAVFLSSLPQVLPYRWSWLCIKKPWEQQWGESRSEWWQSISTVASRCMSTTGSFTKSTCLNYRVILCTGMLLPQINTHSKLRGIWKHTS